MFEYESNGECSTRRRSSRIVKRISYAEYSSPERSSSIKQTRRTNISSDSFVMSPRDIPIFSYSVVNSTCDSNKYIKIKLKLKQNTNCEKARMKSFIKFSDLKEINNNDSQISPQASTSKSPDSTKRSSSTTVKRKLCKAHSSIEQDTPIKQIRSVSSLNGITIPLSEKKVCPSKIYKNEDLGINKKFNGDTKKEDALASSILVTRRSKRNISRPKKYLDNDSKTEIKTSSSYKRSCLVNIRKTTTKPIESAGTTCNTDKELVSCYSRTNRNDNDDSMPSTSSKPLKRNHNDDEDFRKRSSMDNSIILSKLSNSSDRPKRSISLPKKYTDHTSLFITPSHKADKKSKSHNLRKNIFSNSCKKLSYDSSDDEEACLSRISKSKNTLSSRAKLIKNGIITPSVQAREIALINDNTPLSRARTHLHVSNIPNSLPCREKELADIMNFLEGKLLDGCGGCMYISGVPGTGKTATVTEVVRILKKSAKEQKIPSFAFININGMKLSEPRQAYVEIVKQLTGKTIHWEEAQTRLENKFVKSQKKTSPILLIVDELDILCTKRQDVVYNLLDWPTKGNTQLIVVTIANTMDFPERVLMGRVTSRLGLTRLPFQPYTHRQLQEIVEKRLSGISVFNLDAIQLVARKVASISGDARRALDICKRATEIAELEGNDNFVSLSHVDQALKAMLTQPKVKAIKCCSRLEKLILQAVAAEVERTGVEETNFASIIKILVTLAILDGFKMVSNTVAMAAVTRLGLCRLLLVDQKCNNIHQKIILNVSTDDVYYATMKTLF